MTRSDARRALGLAPEGSVADDEVRRAYRRAARALHPDRPGAPSDATARMADVNLAYAVLTGHHPADPEPARRPRPPADAPHDARVDAPLDVTVDVSLDVDGTLIVDAPADETFLLLMDAAERLGDTTYVDRAAGLLQVILRDEAGVWCYLTFTLQGRAYGTEVFATFDAIEAAPPPDPTRLLAWLADELRLAAG